MDIKQIPVGPMDNFSYLIADEKGNAAYIDPGWEVEKVLQIAEENKFVIESVLLTHTHYDHVQELSKVLSKMDVKVFVHEMGSEQYKALGEQLVIMKDNDEIQIGDLKIRILYTPGHKEDCVCYLVDGNLFSGDTLFIDSAGRTDLPGSDPELQVQSLERVKQLPKETMIFPGHNYGDVPYATLGEQMMTNPKLNI